MDLPRVVVVEDDETLAEFFSMVLEMMPLRAQLCPSGEEALVALRGAPADVLVTDLLLPGLDGRGLLKALRADASLRGAARLVVMSGSIDDAVRREMAQLGVWKVLGKPVTVKAFRQCIEEALSAGPGADPSAQRANVISPGERLIIESHFAGDEGLYIAYRQGSLQQFPRDIEQGARAVEAGDLAGLQRVAHNLKSVLKTLAEDHWAEVARDLENELTKSLGQASAGMASNARVRVLPSDLRQRWDTLRDGLMDVQRRLGA